MHADIHSHILPALDDGARDDRSAVEILKMAAVSGTSNIIATPHFISGSLENHSEAIHESCRALRDLAGNEGLDIEIHPGTEVFIDPAIPELIEKGIICTLNDSSFILIELPMDMVPVYTDEVLFNLQLKGLTPIIAHPERNLAIRRNPSVLAGFINRGMLAQANTGSITGLYGREVKSAVIKLIKMGLIQFVGSDAHTVGGRSPDMRKAEALISRKFGSETAQRLFYKNGMAVINNDKGYFG